MRRKRETTSTTSFFFFLFLSSFSLSFSADLNHKLEDLISFIHIPKTGGESIENYMSEHFDLKLGSYYRQHEFVIDVNSSSFCLAGAQKCSGDFQRCPRRGGYCAWWHTPPKYIIKKTEYMKRPLRFCVLRNPFTRIVSEYFNIFGPNILVTSGKKRNNDPKEATIQQFSKYVSSLSRKSKRDCLDVQDDCHRVLQSHFVDRFVDFDYVNRLRSLLENDPSLSCLQALEVLTPQKEKERENEREYGCNFPIRFEFLSSDFDFFIRRCVLPYKDIEKRTGRREEEKERSEGYREERKEKGKEKKEQNLSPLSLPPLPKKNTGFETKKKWGPLFLSENISLSLTKQIQKDLILFRYSHPYGFNWTEAIKREEERESLRGEGKSFSRRRDRQYRKRRG